MGGGPQHSCRRAPTSARGAAAPAVSLTFLQDNSTGRLLTRADALGLLPEETAGPEYESTGISTWKDHSKPPACQLPPGGGGRCSFRSKVLCSGPQACPQGLSVTCKALGRKSHHWMPSRKLPIRLTVYEYGGGLPASWGTFSPASPWNSELLPISFLI